MIVGKGFIVDLETARAWTDQDAGVAAVVRPFLTGDDISSRPDLSASRAVIDFNDRSEEQARAFGVPFARVEELVRPERAKVNRKAHRERWWQFGDKRPALRQAIAGMQTVLVIARTSSNVMPVRVSADVVFGDSLNVFATDSYADQAALSSSLHQLWAITYGGTLETRIRYVPSDVFETFPAPCATERLMAVGAEFEKRRREMMIRRELSLTALYNLVHSPSVQGDADVDLLRDMHVQLDLATLAAYGWDDVSPNPGFHTYRQLQRWTVSPDSRAEILGRLLGLNHERARAEGQDVPGRSSSSGQDTLFA